MKNFLFAIIAVFASSFVSAHAGYMPLGSAAFNSASGSLSGGANTNSAFTFNSNSATSGDGSFSGDVGKAWGSFSVPTFGTPLGFPLTINGDFGTFSGWSDSDDYVGSPSFNFRSINALGFFTRSGFAPTAAYVSLFVQKNSSSYTYGLSISVDPTGAVPEPASMAIFGLGAIGFVARRFRRK
jgi:hypothetical protein